jgi:hypothetical protein
MADAKGPERPRDPKSVFLGALKGDVTEELLRLVMEPAAKGEDIVSISIVPDKNPDYAGCRMAFILCKNETTAQAIIALLDGVEIPEISDRKVEAALRFADEPASKPQRPRLTRGEMDDIAAALAKNPYFAEKCRGKRGESGKDAAPGQKGDKGDPGPVGPQGPKGADGAKGPAGANGQNGPQGPQGPRGKDAPQWPSWVLVAIALVALIFASYAACGSNRGEQGSRGVQGEIGPQGPQGPEGQIGPQGPAGEPGDAAPEPTPETEPAAPEPPAAPAADDGHRGPLVVSARFDNVGRRFHAIDERLDALERARR